MCLLRSSLARARQEGRVLKNSALPSCAHAAAMALSALRAPAAGAALPRKAAPPQVLQRATTTAARPRRGPRFAPRRGAVRVCAASGGSGAVTRWLSRPLAQRAAPQRCNLTFSPCCPAMRLCVACAAAARCTACIAACDAFSPLRRRRRAARAPQLRCHQRRCCWHIRRPRERGSHDAACADASHAGASLREWGAARGVRYFLISYTDLFGVQRSKLVRLCARRSPCCFSR